MITQYRLSIRQVSSNDIQKLANLIHFETYVHRHLDYRPPLDWVGEKPFYILQDRNDILGALACPPDPPRVAWIRLFAASNLISPEEAWASLWPEALEYLSENTQANRVAIIPLHHWLDNLALSSGFIPTHRIVMLRRESDSGSLIDESSQASIRSMTLDDIHAVQLVDEASFVPVWQNSQPCLEHAFRQAALATVAEINGQIIGYQITTPTPQGGHLARLAVIPENQCQGIGLSLLNDVLRHFTQRGARNVTVNTQADNAASLALYHKVGFQFTGEEYSVFELDILAKD